MEIITRLSGASLFRAMIYMVNSVQVVNIILSPHLHLI